jgi:hypothetical protein
VALLLSLPPPLALLLVVAAGTWAGTGRGAEGRRASKEAKDRLQPAQGIAAGAPCTRVALHRSLFGLLLLVVLLVAPLGLHLVLVAEAVAVGILTKEAK